ncbi:MAG: VanW family protein [Armatimonadetes bacterium]|nr:VanW family protein [Armatimonadota bacterium]
MKARLVITGISLLALLAVGGLGAAALRLPAPEQCLGSYGTSLRGRTRSQVYNALRAARALHGAEIPPGGVFSYNRRVGPWNAAAGYRKAPVSYDGEMMPSYGGGVCQTSTTLYNAALLAGLEVVERHRHIRPPTYVAPGRDAAVAMPSIDLRLRNPYPHPVRLEARRVGDSLVVAVRGRGPRRPVVVRTEVEAVAQPPEVRGAGQRKPGQPGFTSLTYVLRGKKGQVLGHEAYPPVNSLKP